MNIRTFAFIMGFCLVNAGQAAFAMGAPVSMDGQQAAMMDMIRSLPKEQVRELAEAQFAGDIQAATASLVNNIRWLGVETALAALAFYGVAHPIAQKAVVGYLGALALIEAIDFIGALRYLHHLSDKQEKFYRHLMSIRAGADMRQEALADIDEEL